MNNRGIIEILKNKKGLPQHVADLADMRGAPVKKFFFDADFSLAYHNFLQNKGFTYDQSLSPRGGITRVIFPEGWSVEPMPKQDPNVFVRHYNQLMGHCDYTLNKDGQALAGIKFPIDSKEGELFPSYGVPLLIPLPRFTVRTEMITRKESIAIRAYFVDRERNENLPLLKWKEIIPLETSGDQIVPKRLAKDALLGINDSAFRDLLAWAPGADLGLNYYWSSKSLSEIGKIVVNFTRIMP